MVCVMSAGFLNHPLPSTNVEDIYKQVKMMVYGWKEEGEHFSEDK